MTLALAVFSCLWSLAEANGHADTFADVALKSASLPRRLGHVGYIHASAHRATLNYYHPEEREGVDLRSFNNVDFRSSLAQKQAAAAAMMDDVHGEIETIDNMDTSADTIDAPTDEHSVMPLTIELSGQEGSAETPGHVLEFPVSAMPVSYGVRIGEDGELDGGEDFGDHVDYDSADLEEDYVEDIDVAGGAEQVQGPGDGGLGDGLQGGDM